MERKKGSLANFLIACILIAFLTSYGRDIGTRKTESDVQYDWSIN